MSDKTYYQDYLVKRKDGRDIEFTGRLIARVSSRRNGAQLRWSDLTLYETRAGVYICEQIGQSAVTDETPIYTAAKAVNIDEVMAFFGRGWLSQILYKEANLDSTEHVA